VSLFLMIYVVPRFASVYEGSGRPLPWQSAWLRDGHPADLHARSRSSDPRTAFGADAMNVTPIRRTMLVPRLWLPA